MYAINDHRIQSADDMKEIIHVLTGIEILKYACPGGFPMSKCLPVLFLFLPLALASMERSLNYPERVMKEPPVRRHYA